MFGPDPNAIHPNENIPSVCYIKNTITRPNIIVGDYTYYDDPVDSEHFEDHVTIITISSETNSSSANSAPSRRAWSSL